MSTKDSIFRSLRFKLIASAVIIEVFMLSLLIWNSMRLMEQHLLQQMEYRIGELKPLLNASLAGPLFQEDTVAIKEVMQQFKTREILFFAIYNTTNDLMVAAGTPQLNDTLGTTQASQTEHKALEKDVYLLRMPIYVGDQQVGHLAVEIDTQFISQAINSVHKQGLLIAIAEITLSLLLLSILGLALTRQLTNLTHAAQKMAEGDMSVRIPVRTRDEIGKTATTFNLMADNISSNQRSLQKNEEQIRKLNSDLEQRIIERTEQLESANEELIQIADSLQQERDDQQILIQQLNDAQNQLLQSEKMASIGQLAAGVAHEINNPIGYVSSNVSSLKQYIEDLFRVLDAYANLEEGIQDKSTLAEVISVKNEVELKYLKQDVIELIGESQEGVTRVKHIVQDLKDFSHVNEADWQWADLHKGINSTLNVAHNETKYKAEIILEYGELPEVECIPSQLNQVFMNLIVNAAHAIPDRGIITIRTARQGDNVAISIADNGKGMPKDIQKKIFEPFFTTKPVGSGTGLGLSLSYGIIDKHGGRIDLHSEEGKGATFTVVLPINQPQQAN